MQHKRLNLILLFYIFKKLLFYFLEIKFKFNENKKDKLILNFSSKKKNLKINIMGF